MDKTSSLLSKLLVGVVVVLGFGWLIRQIGVSFNWLWGDFWLNFVSNAASDAVIGFVLYLIITRPDEKRATQQRRNQALAMLKIEFKINLDRARLYGNALKKPPDDLTPLYPLRFTRGAWNALKESGFLPQLDNMEFVYELLRANEIITVANSSLMKVRNAKADNQKAKLNIYAKKAARECSQLELLVTPIISKLESMKLPEVKLPEVPDTNEDDERD